MVSYCTHGDVSAFLQVDAFADSPATTPTQSQVESFIELAESRIEQLTDHAWSTANAISVTDERVRVQRVQSNVISTRGRIQLRHYPILAFSQHASPSLSQTNGNIKIWGSGSGGYVDYLDSDNSKTLGSNVADVSNDVWADTEGGIIYLNSYSLHNMLNSSPAGVDGYVTYKYATATTPKDIKLACIYFTAAIIVSNDDLNISQSGEGSMDNRSKAERFEDMAMKILKDHHRIDRSMQMARAIGGFGTGMVTP
jgi:hypothetical protein